MGRPVTKVEVSLQQIADSLQEILGLLRQTPSDVGAAVEAGVKKRPAKKAAPKSKS